MAHNHRLARNHKLARKLARHHKFALHHKKARHHEVARHRQEDRTRQHQLGGDYRKDQLQQKYLNTIKVRPIDRLSKTHDSWVSLLDT